MFVYYTAVNNQGYVIGFKTEAVEMWRRAGFWTCLL